MIPSGSSSATIAHGIAGRYVEDFRLNLLEKRPDPNPRLADQLGSLLGELQEGADEGTLFVPGTGLNFMQRRSIPDT
jgi:hypothetical protein